MLGPRAAKARGNARAAPDLMKALRPFFVLAIAHADRARHQLHGALGDQFHGGGHGRNGPGGPLELLEFGRGGRI